MQNAFYILAIIACIVVIIAVTVLTSRALVLMARLEQTRRDLAGLIAEGSQSLSHANRVLARVQEGLDRLRHTADRLDRVLAVIQPASAVGGLLAGAKRMFSGHRDEKSPPNQPSTKGEQ